MKLTLFAILLTFGFSAIADDRPADQTKRPDIYQEVRDILR